jgi:hypothetical protein
MTVMLNFHPPFDFRLLTFSFLTLYSSVSPSMLKTNKTARFISFSAFFLS